MKKSRRRIRHVVWFETLQEHGEPSKGDAFLYRVAPWFYLISVLVFPIAVALAIVGPWGSPMWPWGLLVAATGMNLRLFASGEAEAQGRSSEGFYAFRAWLWLMFGGGIRQAVRTLAVNRRSRAAHHAAHADLSRASAEPS